MTIDECIRRVLAQPVVSVEFEVSVPGPELLKLMNDGQCHTIAELNAHPDQRKEMRTFQYRHILGPALGKDEIDTWQAAHVEYPLSDQIRELLQRIDGIHLWADLAEKRAYFGVLPLCEWSPVVGSLWSQFFEIHQTSAVGKLVLSYHNNGDYLLCYDTVTQEFAWHDLWEFDRPKVARSVCEFLELWWGETAWLDPRNPQT